LAVACGILMAALWILRQAASGRAWHLFKFRIQT
jgi:hypothetical protein